MWTDAPQLSDIDVEDCSVSLLKTFVSRSAPVVSRARLDHVAELRLLEQPWWRKLGDEYHDNKYTQDNTEDDDHSWKVF